MKNNKFEEFKKLKPVHFKGVNADVDKNQKEYISFPCFSVGGNNGFVISCWKLSFLQRIYLLFTGKMWHAQSNFGKELQPISKTLGNKYYLYDKETLKVVGSLK